MTSARPDVDRGLVRRVVELAARAPSVHNTQPWRFVATPAGLDLYADRARQLTILDPTGRQLVLSCGAALGMARLAVRAFGFRCDVELLPDSGDLDHLARLVIGGPAPASADELALTREIGRRRTVRDRFDTTPLSGPARTALAWEAETEHGWLQWVDAVPDRSAVAVLTDRADRIERADPAMRAELAAWRHDDADATDGIGRSVLPLLPAALRASDVPLRDFDAVGGEPVDGEPFDGEPFDGDPQRFPLPAEHPDLAVLCTRYDGPTSWLHAGQATTRVLLRATALGIAASPLTQALDLPWTRHRLRVELSTTGHPHLVLRLGHAGLDRPRSPRRPVEEILTDRP
jgi:nitroreductase